MSLPKLILIPIVLLSFACTQSNDSSQADTIRIAYPAAGTIVSAQVGLTLQKTDILKENGLSATVTPMGTGREMKTALVADQVDVIMTSESNFVVLLGNGFEGYAINSLGSAGRVALVVKKDSPIQTLDDLKGKKIATIFGTSLHKPAVEWANKVGTIGEDIELINISKTGALRAALDTGAIDAAISWDPYLEDDLGKDSVRVLEQTTFDLITVASKKFFDNNPKALKKFDSAFKQAILYFAQNKDQANKWFSDISHLDMEIIDKSSMHNTNYHAKTLSDVTTAISPAFIKKLESLAEFLVNEKLIESKPAIAANVKSF